MELSELRLIVSRYLPIAFVVFTLFVAGGVAASFLPQKVYRTSATIVLDVNNDPELGGVSVQQATFLLPAIQERAMSASMRERASNDVPENYRRIRVTIQALSDTSVLNIRGSSASPEASQAWVNAIADRLVEEQSPDSPVVMGVLDPAPLKPRPVSPNVEPIMVSFIAIGLIAGLFSTLAADRIKQAFDTNKTIRDRLGTTILGEIPVMRRRTERRRTIIYLLDPRHPSLPLTSAFETIRTNVEFRMAQVHADRVAVMSLNRDAGKSMITAGLSYSFAAVGRNVVAIEADLRRPMLADQLDVRSQTGLGDVAAFGPEALVLQPTQHPRLSVLPAGLAAGRAVDVVATTLPGVLDVLADGSRTIFVDSPPLRGAPESAIIIANTRHVILAVNNTSHDFGGLEDAIEMINDSGGVLLGLVINGVSRRRNRSFDDRVHARDGRIDEERLVSDRYAAHRPVEIPVDD